MSLTRQQHNGQQDAMRSTANAAAQPTAVGPRPLRNQGMMPKTEPVRIVIADEHPIFRDGLRRLLETETGLHIVGETSDGSRAVALVRDLVPDILILGLGTSGQIMLDVLRTASCAAVRTILLTGSVDTPEVATALELGARGVVPKDSAADVLFRGIESVMY